MSTARNNYWADRAALLDPAAYVYLGGGDGGSINTFDATVPTGTRWYLVQGWYLWGETAAAQSTLATQYWFHRECDANKAILLPAGTRIRSNPDNSIAGFAYVCCPELVQQSDSRYLDGEELYYSRVERLKSLTLADNSVSIAARADLFCASATWAAGKKIMLSHVSMHDGAWVILSGSIPHTGDPAINLWHEISDSHNNRYGHAMLLPFSTDIFRNLQLQNATTSGDPGDSRLDCWASCKYYELPADW